MRVIDEEDAWAYEIGDVVKLEMTGEVGKVVGRGHYDYKEDDYELRMIDNNGCLRTSTWTESAIVPIGQTH
jgi:hypothetical protein